MRKSSINDNILILLDIMYKSFNYKLDFKSWSKKEFLKFTKDFINGKTEYYMEVWFRKRYLEKVKIILALEGK